MKKSMLILSTAFICGISVSASAQNVAAAVPVNAPTVSAPSLVAPSIDCPPLVTPALATPTLAVPAAVDPASRRLEEAQKDNKRDLRGEVGRNDNRYADRGGVPANASGDTNSDRYRRDGFDGSDRDHRHDLADRGRDLSQDAERDHHDRHNTGGTTQNVQTASNTATTGVSLANPTNVPVAPINTTGNALFNPGGSSVTATAFNPAGTVVTRVARP